MFMDDKKYLDFLVSLILIVLGVFVLAYSIFITIETGTAFIVSPGFLPGLLGGALILSAILLLAESLRATGLKTTLAQLKDWWHETLHSKQTRNTVLGMLIMFVYTCVLMAFLPYWLATLIMLLFLFFYLRSTKPVRAVLIAVLTVALIVGVFQYAFHVRLP